MLTSVDTTASKSGIREKGETSTRKRGRHRHDARLAVSCLALAIGGTLPRPAFALDITVNSDAEVRAAITQINTSAAANSTIILGSSFQLASTTALPMALEAITLDTQGNTLTGASTISGSSIGLAGPFTIIGTGGVVGGEPASGGVDSGTGLSLNGTTVATSVVNNTSITGSAFLGGVSGGTGVSLTIATLENNGAISGGNALSGGIAGSGATVTRGSTLINEESCTIEGGNTNGTLGRAGVGVELGAPGAASTLINNGTIRGGSDLSGG